MAPKKLSISVSIPKALKLSAKETADLKKAFKTDAVRIINARASSDDINVINSGGITVISTTAQTGGHKKKPSKTKKKSPYQAKKR